MEEVTGRLEDEIEVTPEMIEAGVLILYNYDTRFSNEEDIVEMIFNTMNKVRVKTCP